MIERQQIVTTLANIIEENLEVQVQHQMTEDSRLLEDLGLDSIMVLQLVVYIEETFGVLVPEDNLDPAIFQNVGSLVTFIQKLQLMQETG